MGSAWIKLPLLHNVLRLISSILILLVVPPHHIWRWGPPVGFHAPGLIHSCSCCYGQLAGRGRFCFPPIHTCKCPAAQPHLPVINACVLWHALCWVPQHKSRHQTHPDSQVHGGMQLRCVSGPLLGLDAAIWWSIELWIEMLEGRLGPLIDGSV